MSARIFHNTHLLAWELLREWFGVSSANTGTLAQSRRVSWRSPIRAQYQTTSTATQNPKGPTLKRFKQHKSASFYLTTSGIQVHYVRSLNGVSSVRDYIPVPSASQAGPLKSRSSVRRARTVRPTQDCAVPEGSALGGRAGTLGARRGTHFTIERAHRAGPRKMGGGIF